MGSHQPISETGWGHFDKLSINTMMNLSSKKCTPCEGGIAPLGYADIKKFAEEIQSWKFIEEYKIWRLVKNYEFEDFAQAMNFANKIAEIAEEEGHHPNIFIHDWNKVKLEIYTHKIKGLHENDFILATKIDTISS